MILYLVKQTTYVADKELQGKLVERKQQVLLTNDYNEAIMKGELILKPTTGERFFPLMSFAVDTDNKDVFFVISFVQEVKSWTELQEAFILIEDSKTQYNPEDSEYNPGDDDNDKYDEF